MNKRMVAVSGGADSTALVLLLHERKENFEMIFADTGVELPEVYYFLPQLAQHVGKKLHVVSNKGFFYHLVKWGYFLPTGRQRWCTIELKIKPQDMFFKENKIEEVLIGIRADENKTRLNKSRVIGCENIYPLYTEGWSKRDVMALCKKHNMLNSVYRWRTNVSCFCCFNQRKSDWFGLYVYHPILYKIAEEWERQSLKRSGFGWNDQITLEEFRKANENQIKLWNKKDNFSWRN